ncbi:hypothetical protein [uncultured Akkermansia sp.]|uniref:hypothetical protein n=1 Tax=uncultured Akkermansia sp. TaxID=512294 RepID=UPI00262FD5AE|nr:hypothetical protein [uncultured Akkermansia sp.]
MRKFFSDFFTAAYLEISGQIMRMEFVGNYLCVELTSGWRGPSAMGAGVAWSFCHGAGVAENRQGHCGLGAAGMMPEFAGIYVQSVNIETRNTCGTMSFVQLFCIKA